MTTRPPHYELEKQIASLSSAIQPSDGARDKMLDRASLSVTRYRSKQHTARSLIIACALFLVVSPLIGSLTRMNIPRDPSSQQLNAQALEHAKKERQSFNWSLADLFYQLRLNKSTK